MATCFEETCCEFTGEDKSKCNAICPHKPDFADWLSDTGGLRCDDIPSIAQQPLDLPFYVPMIDHEYSRRQTFEWPVVALDTYKTIRVRINNGSRYCAVASTPEGLRKKFRIGNKAKVILRGVAKDPPLERWWENRLESGAPGQIASLGIHAAVAPNFSHFLGVPRTDNLFNRQRQLTCLAELADAGLCVMPHLSAIMPADWQFWLRFLEATPGVKYVAKEFQTGNKSVSEGRKAIDRMSQLQDSLKRDLHPVVIGAAQYVEEFAGRFKRFTLIDSNPFSKAWRRQQFELSAGKQPWYPRLLLKGMYIDDLLRHNVEGYSAWINKRVRVARAGRG